MITDFIPGVTIPPYTNLTLTRVGSTNNVSQAVYLNNAVRVLTLDFTYVNAGVANDDEIATITVTR